MDLLLILTYTAFCVAIFKIFNIPLNKWSVPTAVLGGIVLIGTLILLMNYNHPFTQIGRQVYNTTPIVPTVRGRVVEVNVKPDTFIVKGEALFTIESEPFRAKLLGKKADLAAAEQAVFQLESEYKAAQSEVHRARAERDRVKREFNRYNAGYKKGAFTAQQVDTRRQNLKGAEADLEAEIAMENSARVAFESEVDGENTTVARLKAEVAQAQFDLDETVVRAPTNGYVTQLILRPGQMAVPLPLAPSMVFIHAEEYDYIGAFRQNSLQRLEPGFEAEFMFPSLPGKVFKGEVINVIPAMAEGEIQASGKLLGTQSLNAQGRALVKLRMIDDVSQYHLPLGTSVEVAVYSDSFHHVSIMRKILIRMKSWQNYLYLDH
ncbi:MFP transporter [Vibrio inusitatus NBRC 102082]|uniref:MFP transporter n=1 Tax=Vibrio inusitatus NBRC 102082 TaxID=1219070 RepID=A0A4Y3HU58_9VIBR|nr:HlyD family secretion protein [Vibrio inusitatus]GEA50693.1 MFP transporter [Vibrio inusitatus NBRC 102082]